MNTKPLALVVEDEFDLSIIFSESFKAAGFKTEIIRDGQIAARWLNDAVPDIVALDLHLPNVSGEEILDQIRADSRLTDTHVIVTTADARMAEPLGERGATLVLIKPISFSQLRDLAIRLRPEKQGV
jgi:two-component system cell cycle response regulator DivK